MNDRVKQEPVKTALNDPKLKLYAPVLPGATQAPSLEWGYANNNPFILVRTNFPNDKDYGRIKAALDMPAFYETLALLEKVVATPEEVAYTMENKNKPWSREQGARVKDPILETTTVVGRDKEGKIFIAILHYDKSRPKVIFHFGHRMYHSVHKRNGDLSAAEVSNFAATGMITALREIMGAVAADQYVHKTMDSGNNKGDNRSQRGGNSYTRGNQDNDAGSNSGSDDFDDLPF